MRPGADGPGSCAPAFDPNRATDADGDNLAAAMNALAAAGFAARRWEPIGTLVRAGLRRAAFRVELVGGETVKVRCFRSERHAWYQETIRRRIGEIDGLAPLRFRHGRVAIEAWIDGSPVDAESPEIAVAAAAVLARLHEVRALGRRRMRVERPASRWMDTALRRLEALVAAGAIDAESRAVLVDSLERDDPTTTTLGVAHRDFCAENLVQGVDGRLHAIDNEAMRVDSLDSDLGLVWYRWRMTDDLFTHFVGAYERFTDRRFEHRRFWQTTGLIKGAFVRVRHRLPGASAVAERLTRHAVEIGRAAPRRGASLHA